MAAPFSWSDTINIAFGSCLPCLKPSARTSDDQADNGPHNAAINRIPRARADELQGLLADPDTDVEAETLSLHSNPGRVRRGKKKRKRRTKNTDGGSRRITLFGYDLFGRPAPPPIQLPTEDDDALYSSRQSGSTPTTTMTFDSDAAPLDADAIAAMSDPGAMASAAALAADAEAQRMREKEERRQRRREQREMRRLAEAMATQGSVENTFEGFQGSGGGSSDYHHISSSVRPMSDSGSGSGFSGSASGDFGRFVEAAAAQTAEDDEADAAADLDGGMYARRPPRIAPGTGGSTGSGSRSRTSASQSGHTPLGDPVAQPKAPYKKAKSKSSSSRTSHSHSTATASPSLPSPVSPSFAQEAQVVSPSTIEHGQGFFDLEDVVDAPPAHMSVQTAFTKGEDAGTAFPATRIGGGGGFPSTGFGGGASRARDIGVFLSRRGEDEDAEDGL